MILKRGKKLQYKSTEKNLPTVLLIHYKRIMDYQKIIKFASKSCPK